MIHTIFLDIDGVLNVGAPWFLRAAGVDIDPYDFDRYPVEAGPEVVDALNLIRAGQGLPPMSSAKFWSQTANVEFWRRFPVSRECHDIIDWATRMVGEVNVYLLTSTTRSPECLAGKLAWIHERLPRFLHRQYLIGPPKHLCARPGALLIDDFDKNVTPFRKGGGEALLVPRPWNSNSQFHTRGYLDDAFRELEQRCRKFTRTGGHQAG